MALSFGFSGPVKVRSKISESKIHRLKTRITMLAAPPPIHIDEKLENKEISWVTRQEILFIHVLLKAKQQVKLSFELVGFSLTE